MTTKLDFSNLNLQDALDLAILVEDEAKERYEEFARQIGSSHAADAGSFFKLMAKNEAKHGAELMAQRKKLFGTNPSVVTKTMIDEFRGVEAPEFDLARPFMSAKNALEVALASEVKAYNFYDQALAFVKNDDVKNLFVQLKAEEIEHQNLVKNLIKITSGDLEPEVNPDDVDEPSL